MSHRALSEQLSLFEEPSQEPKSSLGNIPRSAMFQHLSGAKSRVRILEYQSPDHFSVLFPPTKTSGERTALVHRNSLTFLPEEKK